MKKVDFCFFNGVRKLYLNGSHPSSLTSQTNGMKQIIYVPNRSLNKKSPAVQMTSVQQMGSPRSLNIHSHGSEKNLRS